MTIDVIISDDPIADEQNATSNGGGPYDGIIDTTIGAGNPDFVGENENSNRIADDFTSTQEAASIISFDTGLASISGPVTVTSAIIYLGIVSQGGASFTIEAYEVLQSMVYTEATWNSYSTGNSWATAGCKSAGTDYNASLLGSGVFTGTPLYFGSISGSGLDQIIEDQINGVRSSTNIILKHGDAAAGERRDFVAENSTSYQAYMPELVVTYTAGAGAQPQVVPPNPQRNIRKRGRYHREMVESDGGILMPRPGILVPA